MELIKESTVYLNNKKDGGTVNIPKVFFNSHNLKDNREIDIYSDTLEDGRKALVIIPKINLIQHNFKAKQTDYDAKE